MVKNNVSSAENLCENIRISKNGTLLFAGREAVEIIEKYGSPVFVFDEERVRENCRRYKTALREHFGADALPLYASKAASFKRIYEIIAEEGFGTDVVSSGEIYTAKLAGFPLERAYFHSNNKTDADIAYAIEEGVGCFVVDNVEELEVINAAALEKGKKQRVLLRLTPGIDPHTYAAVATGNVDSKFGSAIETGQAMKITGEALAMTGVELAGFHCHVGSQVFDADVFLKAADIMLRFIRDVKDEYGFECRELDLGGGFGVRYTDADPTLDVSEVIGQISERVKALSEKLGITLPKMRFEPGRSIVADACMTLYTVGTVKKIPGYKNYVSVDGGMTDNPRFALYGSKYTVALAKRMNDECDFKCSVVGRCCESGDILAEGVMLPSGIKRGDILAVFTTGAYNYSMSSNYNRVGRLPVVMIDKGGNDYVAVRRESLEDIARNDV
ncbi:MAG: diaminopimelate decarboxylase [Clostridia bacterium]|nr:diaminopimelate decarboxylase [Clostridia bacterium]